MRSVQVSEDLTTRARIRDAAILHIARNGFRAATVRAIAADAGVSAALVLHHFGSKDGLRAACDTHVLDRLHAETTAATGAMSAADVLGQMALNPATAPASAYVARALTDGGDLAHRVITLVTADTRTYLEEGVAAGVIKPSSDPDRRAEMLAMSSLGSIALARYVAPADLDPLELQTFLRRRYGLIGLELYTHGLFTDDTYLQAYRRHLAEGSGTAPSGEPGS